MGRALDAGQPQMQAKLSYLELFKLVHQGLPTAFPIFDKVRELGRGVASLAPQVADISLIKLTRSATVWE